MHEGYKAFACNMAKATDNISTAANKLPSTQDIIAGAAGNPGRALDELIDAGFALSEVLKNLEELEKLVKTRKETIEKAATAIYVSYPAFQQTIETKHTKATISCKTKHPELRRTPQNADVYDKFCREVLKITSEEIIQAGVVATYYPGWAEYISALSAAGESLPDGLDKAFKEYKEIKVAYRKGSESIYQS